MEINLENRDKIIALLREGTCPICGKKGYRLPLQHITKKHGITASELKDRLLIGHGNSPFIPLDLRERWKEIGKENAKNKDWRYQGLYKHNEVYKTKMSARAKEDKNRLEHLKNASKQAAVKKRKSVLRISENGETVEYESMAEAARANSCYAAGICKCTQGKTEKYRGYKWETKN
jgi:hypothetical protein